MGERLVGQKRRQSLLLTRFNWSRVWWGGVCAKASGGWKGQNQPEL